MNITKQRLMDYVIIETIISIFYIFFYSNKVFLLGICLSFCCYFAVNLVSTSG